MLYFITILFVIFHSLISFAANDKVAVIVPLEHEAMHQIVSGIKESMKSTGAHITSQNAYGDQNIQLSIIKQLNDEDVGILMPIGTTACQMTVTHATGKNVICVATDLKTSNDHIVTINDEVPITASLKRLPTLKSIAVIYSASEKIAPEIATLKTYAHTNGIHLHLTMISNLMELSAATKSAPHDTEAFLILKDHLVVSGVPVIVQEAIKRQIPLIASDEGSVKNGASFGIGTVEKDIGIRAGEVAKKIIDGVNPKDIPAQTMDTLNVFINRDNFVKQQVITRQMVNALKLNIIEL